MPRADVVSRAGGGGGGHAVEQLGSRGFQIDTRVEDLKPSHAPSTLSMRGLPIRAHRCSGIPWASPMASGSAISSWSTLSGQPIGEIIAISHFIMGGIPDRHPDLEVVIAHGGGF
ncbi:MAG: hypothetical protein V4477_17950 [Pseudomonadota bacterium]